MILGRFGIRKYNIPKSWLKEYEANTDKTDVNKYNIGYVSLLTGIPQEELLGLTTQGFDKLLTALLNITGNEVIPISEPIINIDGNIYVLDSNTKEMSIGQYSDFDILTKEGDAWTNGHKLTASFIRKATPTFKTRIKKLFRRPIKCSDYKIKPYDIEDLMTNSEVFFEKMPMPYIYTCVAFFLLFKKTLKINTKGYTKNLEPLKMEK